MLGEDLKKVYEQLDTVVADLRYPELTVPTLITALRTIEQHVLDPELRVVMRSWMRRHDVE